MKRYIILKIVDLILFYYFFSLFYFPYLHFFLFELSKEVVMWYHMW